MSDDDWMNPKSSSGWQAAPMKNGVFYQIQRKKRIPVTGNVAFLEQWECWSEYDTKEARDKALKSLRETTSWHLRGRTVRFIHGAEVGGDPFEYRDEP